MGSSCPRLHGRKAGRESQHANSRPGEDVLSLGREGGGRVISGVGEEAVISLGRAEMSLLSLGRGEMSLLSLGRGEMS